MRIIHLVTALFCAGQAGCQDLVLVKSDQHDDDSQVEIVEVSNREVFVPTDEWQEIINGQAIPAGLHVRINMETGKKEARIMQEEPAGGVSGIKHEALKEALKNIKSDFKSTCDKID